MYPNLSIETLIDSIQNRQLNVHVDKSQITSCTHTVNRMASFSKRFRWREREREMKTLLEGRNL